MVKSKENLRLRRIRNITLWGVGVNSFLIILKLSIGIRIQSSALIADGVHSISDLFTDFIILVGARLSNRPPDDSHPYGHSKIETIASQFVAVILLAAGGMFVWTAASNIFSGKKNFPGIFMLLVAAVSVVSKEALFVLTRKVSKLTQSPALYANAWHHRSDSFSSMAVLLGGFAGLLGWGHADHAATIVIGFMIAGVGGKIFYEGMIELTEHSVDEESIRVIGNVLSEEEGVLHWHALRTRRLGAEVFVDVHILVDPNLSVSRGHEISMKVEKKVKESLSHPVNILVHIEPYTKEMMVVKKS